MSIDALPLELVQRVLEEGIPESFAPLRCTCKALYAAGDRFEHRHRQLRRRWRNFKYDVALQQHEPPPYPPANGHAGFPNGWTNGAEEEDDGQEETRVSNALDLLRAVADEPIVARYIEDLDLSGDDSFCLHPDQDPALTELPKGRPDISALRRLVYESPYLAEAGIDPEAWLDKILNPAAPQATLFLLTLLPNVRALTLPSGWARFRDPEAEDEPPGTNTAIWRVVDVLVRQSDGADVALAHKESWRLLDLLVRRANSDTPGDASLAQLREFRRFINEGYMLGGVQSSLTACTPFLALPKLQAVSIYECHSMLLETSVAGNTIGTQKEIFSPRYDRYSPVLKTLELRDCFTSMTAIEEILRRVPGVECLGWGHLTADQRPRVRWDVAGLIPVLQRNAKQLRSLQVQGQTTCRTHMSQVARVDMSGLKALEELDVDAEVLLPSDIYIELLPGAPPLRSLLPPSLKRLTMRTEEKEYIVPLLVQVLQDYDCKKLERCELVCMSEFQQVFSDRCISALWTLEQMGVTVIGEEKQRDGFLQSVPRWTRGLVG